MYPVAPVTRTSGGSEGVGGRGELMKGVLSSQGCGRWLAAGRRRCHGVIVAGPGPGLVSSARPGARVGSAVDRDAALAFSVASAGTPASVSAVAVDSGGSRRSAVRRISSVTVLSAHAPGGSEVRLLGRGGDGAGQVPAGELLGPGTGSAVGEQRTGASGIGGVEVRLAQQRSQLGPLGGGGRVRDQCGALALAQVAEGALAGESVRRRTSPAGRRPAGSRCRAGRRSRRGRRAFLAVGVGEQRARVEGELEGVDGGLELGDGQRLAEGARLLGRAQLQAHIGELAESRRNGRWFRRGPGGARPRGRACRSARSPGTR